MVSRYGQLMRRCAAGLLAFVLSGCTMMAPERAPPPPGETVGVRTERGREPETERTGGEASRLLLRQSRAERAAGNYADAAASLERAIRIDPQDPLLWLELGYVKLAEGDRAQAQTMAHRALTLAAGDASVESGAERLLSLSQGP